jgi:hypothetical protein
MALRFCLSFIPVSPSGSLRFKMKFSVSEEPDERPRSTGLSCSAAGQGAWFTAQIRPSQTSYGEGRSRCVQEPPMRGFSCEQGGYRQKIKDCLERIAVQGNSTYGVRAQTISGAAWCGPVTAAPASARLEWERRYRQERICFERVAASFSLGEGVD